MSIISIVVNSILGKRGKTMQIKRREKVGIQDDPYFTRQTIMAISTVLRFLSS